MEITQLKNILPHLSPALLTEISENEKILEIPSGTEILREGQYVKVIPIVFSGLIKVFSVLITQIKTTQRSIGKIVNAFLH